MLQPITGLLQKITEGTLGGIANGELDPHQFTWMVEDIEANQDKLIFVFAHHPTSGYLDPVMASKVEDALSSYPNVVAYVAGHHHQHKVEPQKSGSQGYWKIETASLIDLPSEGRAMEIRDNGDGTGSLILTCVQEENPEFLALAASDPQADPNAKGTELDRNVVLKFSIPPRVAQSIHDAYGTPGPIPPPGGLSNPISADDFEETARYYGSYLAENSAGKKLLYLDGDAYQRGYAEGYLCPESVYRMTHDYIDNFLMGITSLPLVGPAH